MPNAAFDIKGVFNDGDKVEDFGINLCDLEAHTFYEEQ